MLQAKMADMYVKLNTARSYTYNVARAMDNGLFPSKVSFVPYWNVMFFASCLFALDELLNT